MPNINEFITIIQWGGNSASRMLLQFLSKYNSGTAEIWTSSTRRDNTSNAIILLNNRIIDNASKANSYFAYQCRYYTFAELGL